MKVYLLAPNEQAPFAIHNSWEDVLETIEDEGDDTDQVWRLQIVDMSPEEIAAAPEFDGW